MRRLKNFLLFLLLAMPCMVFASGYTYSDGVTKANNYINGYEDRYKYLNFNKPYRFDGGKACYDKYASCSDTSNPGSTEFFYGGFLNRDEYLTTLGDGGSYLSPGSEYWTMTFSDAANKVYTISNILKNDKSLSDSVGVRVTEFVKSDARVTGTGKPSDPWMFYPQYRVTITTRDASMGKIVDKDGTSKETVEFYLGKGQNKEISLDVTLGYRYISNTCGLEYRNNKLVINSISKDYGCIIEFDRAVYSYDLTASDAEEQARPQKIYHILGEDWYSNEDLTNKFTALVEAPKKSGYTFDGFYYGNPNTYGVLVIKPDKTLVPGIKITPTNLDNTSLSLIVKWKKTTFGCPAGEYLPKSADGCKPCLAGSYCVGGTYIYNETIDQGINKCPTGYTSAAKATAENKCYIDVEAGKYIATAKASTKTNCPAGKTSENHQVNYGNTSSCTDCPAGYYCPAGSPPQRCPEGYRDGGTGAKAQTECKRKVAAGYRIATAKATTNTACATGTYKEEHLVNYNSTSTCAACPNGYKDGAGTTAQTNCQRKVAAGYRIATAKATTNTACATGTYKGEHLVKYGATSTCDACPTGYQNGAGATSQANCQRKVAAGKYLATAKATTDTNCGAGKYNPEHLVKYGSTSSCSACPAGYTDGSNASSQATCQRKVPAGYRIATAKATSNTACGTGTYKEEHMVNYNSTSTCAACPNGYKDGGGTTAQTNCQRKVAAGYRIATANATSNTACATGTYKGEHYVKYGNTSTCDTCPAGYQNGAGATSQANCQRKVAAGKYLATAKATTDTNCGAGKYNPEHLVKYGSTSSCSNCPAGYTDGSNASSQATCQRKVAAGYRIASARATTNTKCGTGTYKGEHYVNYGSTSACDTCPTGYQNGAGTTSQANCTRTVTAGKYIATARSATETACANGKWKAQHSVKYGDTSSCSDCPVGYRDGAGATAENRCQRKVPAGYRIATARATTNTACAAHYHSSQHYVYYGNTSSCTGDTFYVHFSCPSGWGSVSNQQATYGSPFTLTSRTCTQTTEWTMNGWTETSPNYGTSWTTSNTRNWTWTYTSDVYLTPVWVYHEPAPSNQCPDGCQTLDAGQCVDCQSNKCDCYCPYNDWAYRNMGGYWCYVGGWDNPDYEAQLCGWSGLC